MTRPVRFRPEAEAEIREAFQWYEEQAPGLGHDFLRAIQAAIASIERSPRAYPTVHKSIRRSLLRRFPYGLFYLTEPDAITILACFHARRDPKAWQDRL